MTDEPRDPTSREHDGTPAGPVMVTAAPAGGHAAESHVRQTAAQPVRTGLPTPAPPPLETPPPLAECVMILVMMGMTAAACWLLYRPMLLQMAHDLLAWRTN